MTLQIALLLSDDVAVIVEKMVVRFDKVVMFRDTSR